MNKNDNLLQRIGPTEDLADKKKTKSLEKVCEEIQQAIDVVERSKDNIKNAQTPQINGQPWYKFSFGKASVEEVNTALKLFSDFVIKNLNLIATVQGFQNENDQSICRLIGLLAIAEANTYSKINDLSTEDEASAKQLKKLQEEFERSIEDTEKDCTKKGEQMNILIDYITCFTESKTKKLRSIELKLSEMKQNLETLCSEQGKWYSETEAVILNWKESTNKHINEIKIQFDEKLEVLNEETAQLQRNNDELKRRVQELSKKSFFDSVWYKAAVGVAALVALGISIFSVL